MDGEKTAAGRLPDAELEVMLAVWRCAPPVTTARQMLLTDPDRNWKTSTVISFLERLKNRGFLSAEKQGREYVWTPAVSREEYVGSLTREFFARVHGGSVASLMSSLFPDGLSPEDADGLLLWLEEREGAWK